MDRRDDVCHWLNMHQAERLLLSVPVVGAPCSSGYTFCIAMEAGVVEVITEDSLILNIVNIACVQMPYPSLPSELVVRVNPISRYDKRADNLPSGSILLQPDH